MSLGVVMGAEEIEAFLDEVFPQMRQDGKVFRTVSVEPGRTVVRFEPNERHMRPGNTLSGPSMFALVDVAAYIAVLAHVGPQALAVTTSANLNFLHRPAPGPLSCETRLIKLGKRLAVTDALVTDEGGRIVAQASLTSSVPPRAPSASSA
jgi:uncharacterized protein (TIGR00369 family)